LRYNGGKKKGKERLNKVGKKEDINEANQIAARVIGIKKATPKSG
jgi:hypothetical protein